MTDLTTPAEQSALRFDAPGGFTWERDTDHQSGPRAPMMREPFDDAFRAGTAVAFDRLGAPLSHGEAVHVHGWSYLRMVPAGVPDKPGASKPPPAPVLKVLTRLIPELRRRERNARAALEAQAWMDDVRGWWAERPDRDARFRARQERDLATLDDAALAGEVEAAVADGIAMLERHFELITPAAGIGLALTAAVEHGLAPTEVPEALRGPSESTAAPRQAVEAIARELDDAGAGPVTDLDSIRSASEKAARLVDDYLDEYGWRLLGDDLDKPTLAESPDALARAVTRARAGDGARVDGGDPVADLVANVGAEHRDAFERRLRDAARCYEMLDDNSSYVCWGLGVARRAVLEAARRLADGGPLRETDDVWLLTVDEVVAELRGRGDLTSDTIAARAETFDAQGSIDAPDVLGGPVQPPPDSAVFPVGLRTIADAVGLYLSLRFPPADARADTGRVEIDGRVVASGHGVGTATATGRAVVAATPHEAIERLEPGDVLVCPVTNPAYNVLFPIASAVVTAAGGPFGHTAVTAREVGIPAVVGIGDLSVITDGVEITVNAGA